MQVEKKGVIYFEDYCKLMLRKYREEDEQEFIRIMFKVNPSCSYTVKKGKKIHKRSGLSFMYEEQIPHLLQ
jgi:hypothetical protein